jgi:hypothetical protein
MLSQLQRLKALSGRMTVNDESESKWKEMVTAYLKILSQHSSGGTEKKFAFLPHWISWLYCQD